MSLAFAFDNVVAGVGLLLGEPWGCRLAWVPCVVLVYHAIGFWARTGAQRRAGGLLFVITSLPASCGRLSEITTYRTFTWMPGTTTV